MNLKNVNAMVLGGWGLVGMAVCRRILERGPKKLIILSLRKNEAEEACAELAKEFPSVEMIPIWGDLFLRESLKDIPRKEIIGDQKLRWQFIEDTYEKLTPERLKEFFLYKIILQHRPDVIVDCINAATGLAYQDVYSAYYDVKGRIENRKEGLKPDDPFFDNFEKFLSTGAIPQLIRHIQVLLESTKQAKVHTYVKVGTCGTGGMGLNIPYTHSEDKPSGTLLSKSSLAGAHSMLLFLMGRTPGCPYIKEIKPGAAIAWKRIAYGEVKREGKTIPLFDCPIESAEPIGKTFLRNKPDFGKPLGENFKSVFIDTGENGIFSADEFFTITAADQMAFVTPEEIAQSVLWEIEGGNSGMDIVGALDASVMGPTYRSGILRQAALDQMTRLEKQNDTFSVAFEMLGPPQLSKLLYEAHMLKLAYPNVKDIQSETPEKVANKLLDLLSKDGKLRATIISIGVPVLLPDGKKILRGPEVKIPPYTGSNELTIEAKSIDEWANKGWIDLRPSNMKRWQTRLADYLAPAAGNSQDTSSGFQWNRMHHDELDEHFVGKIVTYIMIEEEKGERIKS